MEDKFLFKVIFENKNLRSYSHTEIDFSKYVKNIYLKGVYVTSVSWLLHIKSIYGILTKINQSYIHQLVIKLNNNSEKAITLHCNINSFLDLIYQTEAMSPYKIEKIIDLKEV